MNLVNGHYFGVTIFLFNGLYFWCNCKVLIAYIYNLLFSIYRDQLFSIQERLLAKKGVLLVELWVHHLVQSWPEPYDKWSGCCILEGTSHSIVTAASVFGFFLPQ